MMWVTRQKETAGLVGEADLWDGGHLLATVVDTEWWMDEDKPVVHSEASHEDAKDAAWTAVYRCTR